MLLPLLAFGWINLPMLGWLAAAAVPVLIHLWSRRKHRETPWAAMEYLLAAVRQKARRIRFDQWLLLAVRTLLVVLLVLAVAEPYAERVGMAVTFQGGTHRLLVIDGSYSMAYRPTDKTRFERAKALARQVVEESPQGDGFTLILMSSPPLVVVGTPAMEPREILEEIDNLRLQHTTADLPAAVASVRQVIDDAKREQPRLLRHEVYFLTDLQQVTWAPKLPDAAAAEFLKQSQELGATAALFVIDVGQPQAENLAVIGLRPSEPVVTVDRDVQFDVALKNFGRQARRRQQVEMLVDRRRVEQKTLDIAADGTASIEFSCRFDAPMDHTIEIHAPGDGLDVDNHCYLALPVRQAIRVLCIDGRPSGTPFHGATDYLALALSPQGDRAEHALVQAEVAPESALLDRNLGNYDCLFLCNVAQFTASEARVLDTYLCGGGSLVFFLGDQVVADRYNSELGEESHLLPAEIGPLVEASQLQLDPLGYEHPIVKPFQGRGEASLLTTPVWKYFKLALPEGSPAKTVLALSNGDPLVVEEPVERGRVVLVASSADLSWTAMPLYPSYVTLVQEIVAWCAAGQIQQRNLTVGEPLDVAIDASTAETPLSVLGPDGRSRTIQRGPNDEEGSLKYADTMQSGIYVVRAGPPLDVNETFAVNVDTIESNLTPVDLTELRHQTWRGVPFVHQTSWEDLGPSSPGVPLRTGGRLHLGLLYIVLALLFVETWLAWQRGGGDEGRGMNCRIH